MARLLHVLRRVLVVAALVVTALVVTALVLARTDWARDRLREEARAYLRDELGLEATFRDAEVELLPPRGHILGVQIDGADGEPLVTAARLTVGLSPAALLAGRLEVDEVTVEEPHVHLVIESGRLTNLPVLQRSGTADGGEAPADVGIVGGSVDAEWRDAPGGPLNVVLREANVDLTRDRSGDLEMRVLVAGGSLEQGRTRLPVELLQARVMVLAEERRARGHHVRARLGDVRVSIPSITVGLEAPHDLEGELELSLPLELVAAAPIAAPPLSGAVQLGARVSRANGRLEAEGRASVRGLVIGPEFIGRNRTRTWGPHAIGDVATTFSYRPEQLELAELSVDRPAEGDGRVVVRNLRLQLNEPELPIEADVELRGVELAHILIDAGLYASRVRARIDGRATLSGAFRDFRLRFLPLDFRIRDFAVLTASITKPDASVVLAIAQATLRGKVVITGEEVRLREMTASFGSTALSILAELGVRGPGHRFSLRTSAVAGRFRVEDAAPIAGLAMEGAGSVRAHIHGPYNNPRLDGHVDLADFRIGSVRFGDVRGPVLWSGTTIGLPGVAGARGGSRYRFEDGRVVFAGGGVSVDGRAVLEPVDVQDAVEMFGLEMAAARPARGEVTGEAGVAFRSRGNRWTVDLRGSLARVAYGAEELGDGEVDLTWDRGDIELRSLVLQDGDAEARASGTIARTGALDLEISVPGYPIQSIESRPSGLAELQGRLRGAARLTGTTRAPIGRGWVELSPVELRGARLGPSRLLLELERNRIRASGGLGGRALQIEEVTLGLSAPHPLWLRAVVEDLDVTALLGADRLPEGMRVRVGGVIDGGVELRARPRVAGTARIDRLLVTHPAFEIANEEPVELDLARHQVNVSTSRFAFRTSSLPEPTGFTLGGWASATALGLELRGTVDLGFLPAVVSSVAALEGLVTVDCEIGGPFARPVVAGTAELQASQLLLSGLPYPVEGLAASFRFSRNAVAVETATARVLGGRVTASGLVTLSGLSLGGYRLELAVRDASLPLGPRSSAIANAALEITSPTGEGDLPLVGGRAELVRFRYQEPIRLGGDLGDLGLGHRRLTEVRTFDPEGDRIRFDVQLVGAGNMRIENNLARATVLIDDAVEPFRFVGTNQTYGFLGRLAVERRGTVTFRDNQFELERGFLEFDDPYDIDPRLDFIATATRRDWLITLQVAGTRREPILMLRSDPPLSEDDIALLLTVGLTREETEQLGYDSVASSAGLELLWSLSGVDDEVSRLVPVFDELRVTTDYSRRTGRAEPRVRIGRRLTDGIRLGGSVSLSERREFETNLEVQITDSVSFEVAYGNDSDYSLGNIGGDLRWRIEF